MSSDDLLHICENYNMEDIIKHKITNSCYDAFTFACGRNQNIDVIKYIVELKININKIMVIMYLIPHVEIIKI